MLYHYTSFEGLIQIINNNGVWASHCKYMNDSSEYIDALNFPISSSNNIYMEDSYLSPFANAISNALVDSMNNDVYISSFSEKPDLISQ